MKKKSPDKLSKTRLRMGDREGNPESSGRRARIEELYPENPVGLDDILFDISGEPLFPPEPCPLPTGPQKRD